jgi:hypothetical protein
LLFVLVTTSCEFFKSKDEDAIDIPKGITAEQLQDTRYKFKRDKSYKQQFLNQQKTDSAVITITTSLIIKSKMMKQILVKDSIIIFSISP